MQVQRVDPRDIRWELDQPVYRVHFWRSLAETAGDGWASEEWGIRDADVSEVLTWTAHAKEHRAFAVYVCFSNDGGPGLVRLLGKDPTASTD
jgi:hypothetical protein